MKRVALMIGILLPALGSCEWETGPDDVAGEYVLEDTPAVLQPAHGRYEIHVDTLRLRGGGSATRIVVESFESESDSQTREYVAEYRYSARRGRVELELMCPPNALCTAPPHIWGSATSSGLILRHALDPSVQLRYERTAR